MAILKNTIINGNLKVNSDATVNGDLNSNYIISKGGTFDELTISDGDLGILGGDILFNDGSRIRALQYFDMANGDNIQINTFVHAGNPYSELIDNIYITIFVTNYHRIIDRQLVDITSSGNGYFELGLPATSNGSASMCFSTKALNKIYYKDSGILKASVTANASLRIVIEYTKQLTTIG